MLRLFALLLDHHSKENYVIRPSKLSVGNKFPPQAF